MKKIITIKSSLRAFAILLLLCMIVPQITSCGFLFKSDETEDSESVATDTEGEETEMSVPENFKFKTAAGFVINGNVMTMNYTGENNILDLSKRISVKMGSKWCLTNSSGTKDKEAQAVALSNGENVFYVKVTVRGESFIYKMVINYRDAYTVEFYSNCNEAVATQYVNKGEKVSAPATPIREGYTFRGWYLNGAAFDFATAPTESITLIAHWEKYDSSVDSNTSYDKNAPVFMGINAGLHIVWKDYANPNGTRPDSVDCVLTQSYSGTTKTYDIVLSQFGVKWKDESNTPGGAVLEQGEGGDWTLSLRGLPESVGGAECAYTLKQTPLEGSYTTLQSGTEVINTLADYIPSIDETAKLTTRNSRLYDAAGNMVVFKGVVTYNIGLDALNKSATPAAFAKLADEGCNAIRVSTQLIGTCYTDPNTKKVVDNGNGYVWRRNASKDDPARTGAYSDAAGDVRVSAEGKEKVLDKIDEMVQMATDEGLYIIINWAILTSNPYQYVTEASEFFGKLAMKYADNPYVVFEICNEPGDCGWETNDKQGKGIKEYAETIIDVVRSKGSDAIIVVSPRGSAYFVAENTGDDPISSPLDDDRRYNVAYTFHNYPYVNSYGKSSSEYSYSDSGFGWRIQEAYEAGLTIIVTEMSPMNAKFATASTRDPIGYDMEHMALFLRQFQELDISFFYFRYGHSDSYNEWLMFKPNTSPELGMWDRDDLTECGKWYYDIINGDGVFITDVDYTVDYEANRTLLESKRAEYTTYQTTYGLGGIERLYGIFPTFALEGIKTGSGYYFKVSDSDTLTDIQYQTYCSVIFDGIYKEDTKGKVLVNKNPKKLSGEVFTLSDLPTAKDSPMSLTYEHGNNTYTLSISYGQNTDGSWGVTLEIK